ncbi:fimbrillin family protein [Parabacteroides sp.]
MEELWVLVWVDNANDSKDVKDGTSLYKVTLQQGTNGFLIGDKLMYFPQDGNAVNIYAYRGGWGSISGSEYPTNELRHSVATNLRSSNTASANYGHSDLLYAKETNAPRTTPSVQLTFHHLLSKIEVVLMEGAGDKGFLGGSRT